MAGALKRSWQPPFWLLFGAGGMLSALVGWMLVLVTGIAVPLGLGPELLAYDNVAAFARHPAGKLAILASIALFLFHAAHRIYHTLHDFGIRPGAPAWLACYGVAMAASALAAYRLVLV